jgi:hypothetical protein
MRKKGYVALALALVTGLVAFSLIGGAAAQDGTDRRLRANLTGDKEVPGPGDDNGWGRANVRVFPAREKVCFRLRWAEIAAPTAAHIHAGTRTEAGPIVVTLFMSSASPAEPPTLPDTLSGVQGCSDMVEIPEGAPFDNAMQLLRNINGHPRQYYVNIHNLDFPGGAIRGQLHRVGG